MHLRTLDFLNNFKGDGVSASESCVTKGFEQIGSHTVKIDVDIDASDVDAVNAACEAIGRSTSKGRKVTLFSGKEDYRSRWFRVDFEMAGLMKMSVGVSVWSSFFALDIMSPTFTAK